MIELRNVAAAVVGMAIGLGGAGMPAALAIRPPAADRRQVMVSGVRLPKLRRWTTETSGPRGGSNVVMGGNLASVNGQAQSRVAVFNPTTGALSASTSRSTVRSTR